MKYSELLAVVYKRLAEEWGAGASWDECQAYGNSIKDWPAFADSAQALAYLKKHYKLVILSNIDNASFAHSNRKLQVEFDAIYTAQDIGSYKPSGRNFDYMIDKVKFRDRQIRNPAYGRKSVSRPCSRQQARARVVLDLPAPRSTGFRGDDESGRHSETQFPL
jgi:2-haloalkanoic acid dehalogenase type II